MDNVTREQVLEIVGHLDEERVIEIIDTGATAEEVMEAWTWLASDDTLGRDLHRQPSGRVEQVIDILRADELDRAEREG